MFCLLFLQISVLPLESFIMAAPSEQWHPLTNTDAKKPDKNSGLVSFLLQHSEMVLLKFCYWLSLEKKQTPDQTFFPPALFQCFYGCLTHNYIM